jgi:hypothetical protein
MIDCSKTENYLIEKLRMTKRAKSEICKIKCSDCPLCSKNNGISEYISCISFEMYHPEKAIEIVQRWSDAHPQRTYLSQFLEHYPNVQLYDTGLPKGVCPYNLGLTDIDDCDNNCVKCWNQTVEDGEE